jgi:23S rRNA (uracil1939-C5)-methyltransferase
LAGLKQAVDQKHGLKEVRIECRNLFDAQMEASELKKIKAVVFDPPRSGAKAQAEALAVSDIARVIGVSCDPGTFARDAQILEEGGYTLEWVAPVDQFLWSHHIEIVGCFTKKSSGKVGTNLSSKAFSGDAF